MADPEPELPPRAGHPELHFIYVALGGAIGSITSVFIPFFPPIELSKHVNGFSATEQFIIETAVTAVMGGIAAMAFVYLIAGTDRRDGVRLISLALLCGVFWNPVITSARDIALKAPDNQNLALLAKDKQRLISEESAPSGESNKDLTEIAKSIDQTILSIDSQWALEQAREQLKPLIITPPTDPTSVDIRNLLRENLSAQSLDRLGVPF